MDELVSKGDQGMRFRPIADNSFLLHSYRVKAPALFIGLLGGIASVVILGSAQLIWAQSEPSYYVQLLLACGCLGILLLLARSASVRMLGTSVAAAALLIAVMPFENRLLVLSKGGADVFDQLTGTTLAWVFYGALLALWAFGLRRWFTRNSRGRNRANGRFPRGGRESR